MTHILFLRPSLVKKEAYLIYLSQIDESKWHRNYGTLNSLFESRLLAFIYTKKNTTIDNYSYIGGYSSITGSEEVVFEDFSSLSMGCRVFTGSEDFIGNGFGNPTVAEEYRNVKRTPVRISRLAIVGANSMILPV